MNIEKTLIYKIKEKENDMKTTIDRVITALEKEIANYKSVPVDCQLSFQGEELASLEKRLREKLQEREQLKKIRYITIEPDNCIYIGDYDVILRNYELDQIKKVGTLKDFADCDGKYIDAINQANIQFQKNGWKLLDDKE